MPGMAAALQRHQPFDVVDDKSVVKKSQLHKVHDTTEERKEEFQAIILRKYSVKYNDAMTDTITYYP